MELKEFLLAVFSSWVERVGIILTVVPFIENIRRIKIWLHDKPILENFKWLLWVFGGLCIFWGFYSAWLDQRNSVTSVQKQKDELQIKFDALATPILSGTVDTLSIAPGKTAKETVVTLWLTIRNRGAQTIAEDFTLKIASPKGDVAEGILIPPPNEGSTITLSEDKNPQKGVILYRDKSLLLQAKMQPIAHNGSVDGYIMFSATGLTKKEIEQIDSLIEVGFRDINGTREIARYRYTDKARDGLIDLGKLQSPEKKISGAALDILFEGKPLDGRTLYADTDGTFHLTGLSILNVGDRPTPSISVRMCFSDEVFAVENLDWSSIPCEDSQAFPTGLYFWGILPISPKETWTLGMIGIQRRGGVQKPIKVRIRAFFGGVKPAEANFIIKRR